MNPQQNLQATVVIAQARLDDWQKFRRVINQRRQPTTGGGVGRSTDVSDPTGNAVAAASVWDEYEQECAALTVEALGILRQLEQKMHRLLHVDLTRDEQSKMRCNGKHDPTCTELASVGPTGRPDRGGACIRCYTADRRAKVEA